MSSVLPTGLCIGLMCLFASPAGGDDAQGRTGAHFVGQSRVDVTPDYPIRLNGFGNRREESTGVSQSIFARGLAISNALREPPLVLLAVDSVGVRFDMVDEVARRLRDSHQIPRANVALTFTHSHCTPKVNGACDNIFSSPIPPEHQEHIDRYTNELTDLLTETAQQAIESRSAATMEWGVGTVEFATNRRTPGGPVDHSLPTLVVRDAESNEIRAVYTTYACHATVLSFNLVNGDWPGYAAEMIERQHPGAIALVSMGAGSDSKPLSGVVVDKVEVAEAYGLEIADEVARLVTSELKPVTGAIRTTLNRIDLPLNELPTREVLTELAKQPNQHGYNAQTQLARLDRGEPLIREIDYPIQSWSFGDSLCMVFLAGEVCVDYSLRLKSELDRDRVWLHAYSNDFCSYIPSERLVKEGRYGGGSETPYFALPTTLKAGLEQLIVDEVHRQVPEDFEAAAGTNGIPPKSPEESLNCLRTHDDLDVQLVAAEPLISDPVAIDFGPDGRLWVAEMNDYGRGVYEQFPQSGRIRCLKDTDDDGVFDDAATFVDGLRFPTDVKFWRDGVLICDAPDILFARDTDGDGTADVTEKLFSGFSIVNAQARVNSLRFGLDNWIYGATGIFGGQITSHKTGQVVGVGNRDFRLAPDTGAIEAATGNSQQGRDRTDWGDWFGCSSGTLLKYFPTVARYSGRNPYVPPSPSIVNVSDVAARQLFPPENLVRFELSGAPGAATAACGLGIYRDSRLGSDYRNNAFTCEPVHQLVHRTVLHPDGAGFVGRRAENESETEFLVSDDNWFRPVQVRTGPDGGLWVVDMYRYVIEHSRWIPQETLQQVDVSAGQGRGRIYRVVPAKTSKEALPRLDSLSTNELINQLDSSNGPLRDLAHQMLIWRSDQNDEIVVPLRQFAESAATPLGRIHAINALQYLGGLDEAILQTSLADEHPEVVRQAVRLSESRLNDSPALFDVVVALVGAESPRVRQQVAWSLGETTDERAAASLARLLITVESDAAVRQAATSSLTAANINPVFDSYSERPAAERNQTTHIQLAELAIRIGDQSRIVDVLDEMTPASNDGRPLAVNAEAVVTLLNAADRRAADDPIELPDSLKRRLSNLMTSAVEVLGQEDSEEAQCRTALTLWGRRSGPVTQQILDDAQISGQDVEEVFARMAGRVSPRYPLKLQQHAVASLTGTAHSSVGQLLLPRLPTVGVTTSEQIIDVLLSRNGWTLALLDHAESGQWRLGTLNVDRQHRLLTHQDKAIREKAGELLAVAGSSSRAEVVAAHEPVLSRAADLEQGRQKFRKRCSVCHRLENHGSVVGPELMALTNRDPKWLLGTILDPNREVDARYSTWTALTNDGRTVTGVIAEESATSIRLRAAEGKDTVLLRNDIDELVSTGRSLMPEGLERELSHQDLADIIGYVIDAIRPSAQTLAAAAEAPLPRYPPQIAPYLLDESIPVERRQQAIDQRPGMGPAILKLLVADLRSGDLDQEYVRIPWIWRVSLAVGKRNDGGEIGDLLESSLPVDGQPLHHWQAVAIGGGIINGLTQVGQWPKERIAEILQPTPEAASRWDRALQLSVAMADDEQVKPGTRYDALRMIAMQGWEAAGPQLVRFLDEDAHPALQMGAVSGLCDIRSPHIIDPLIAATPRLSDRNRQLSLEGLTRTPERALALIDAIAADRVDLDQVDHALLTNHRSRQVRQRALETLR